MLHDRNPHRIFRTVNSFVAELLSVLSELTAAIAIADGAARRRLVATCAIPMRLEDCRRKAERRATFFTSPRLRREVED